MSGERIIDSRLLKAGDVVLVATKTRKGHWWRRFAVVIHQPVITHCVEVAHLAVDMSVPELKEVDLETEVVHLVTNDRWPDGVSAMYAKALAKGWIKLD